ncbi:hypothetical protein GEV41_21440 [Pseudomonas putida]|nr:hypothetical protein GEV41_21440 [Pseudomonas putida]
MRANALAHGSISRRTNKAIARAWHRMDWPETNVGAGLPAKRRAGGARSHRRHTPCGKHPAALTQPPSRMFLTSCNALSHSPHAILCHTPPYTV